jgi:hypothetical protein
VPLLFAVTLFVSASLLFMVQPMVGKLVLPLLGGSPAVWNACMVFFQALLLLGYLYADRLTKQPSVRRQWVVHIAVMSLPVAAFALAVVFGSRGTPIAVAESLAPNDGSSAIISVLTILTVAIGVPFFVCSTSATLLQKWFTYTGHPSARDPYFLYAASNFGSLISLLGYPIFIEPNMTQGAQTWFWAAGFVGLFGLIAFCGYSAVNPLGVPPSPGKIARTTAAPAVTGGEKGVPPADEEAPPTLLRMAKWTLLAFVPSSLMLGVTFHMTTDIASIPLLWVGPLALYLVTFIIAFGKVPTGFRILIGNLAPVMILLLIFLMLSEVKPGTGLELLLYNLTFFAAAMMCHYELAIDRPSPKYLTTYFLIMSFGGVLGGIFNSLLAPLVFPLSYEFPLALVVACFMVPKLLPGEDEVPAASPTPDAPQPGTTAVAKRPLFGGRVMLPEEDYLPTVIGSAVVLALASVAALPAYKWYIAAAVAGGALVAYLAVYNLVWKPVWPKYKALPSERRRRIMLALDVAIPILLGVVFYHMPRTLYSSDWYGNWVRGVLDATSRFRLTPTTANVIVLFAVPVMVCFFFVDRPLRFGLCVAAVLMPAKIREGSGRDVVHTERSFFGILKIERNEFPFKSDFETPDGKTAPGGSIEYLRLVHGTTLHGTQAKTLTNHSRDLLQMLTVNPWDNLAVTGAITHFDMRQEPLTYYHRTGPVGAMFNEIRSRKGGADAKAHVSMVGLGTGSASCYALPGQRLTFYEIDPAVKELVADTDKYFTFVKDAERRGGLLDFRMGDARLKLKETDDKYALLLVDAFSSDSIPVHLLTVEAVGLYLDRITDDGILALHISNKYVRLEPVVAAIAEHHKLTAWVWNDDAEKMPGKTASSWVALARKPEHLGNKIVSTMGRLVGEYGDRQMVDVLKYEYPELKTVMEKVAAERGTSKLQDSVVEWLEKRSGDAQAQRFTQWLRKYSMFDKTGDILRAETGYGFRPVRTLEGVDAWTDDYADVMRVMMIKELQSLRRFFGLPTPVDG